MNEENAQHSPQRGDDLISRRKVLASLGMAGVTLASLGVLNSNSGKALAHSDDGDDEKWKNIKKLMSMSFLVTTTIEELRTISEPDEHTFYFVVDAGQEGVFYYDSADTASEDNTGTVLVSISGKRFKRVYDGAVRVDWFGAQGDGVADDTQAIIAADNEADGGIVLLTKAYVYSQSGHKLKSRFAGNGSLLNYTGVYDLSFTGSGNNDAVVTGSYTGGFEGSFLIEIGTESSNNWRWSPDNGATWIADEKVVLPDDTLVTLPLTITTTPQALGSSGLFVHWRGTSGHFNGDRWIAYTDQSLRRLDVNGMDLRGQPLFREGGTRSLGFGKNVFGSGTTIGAENIGFGVDVLSSNVNGFANVAYGVKTMENNRSGNYNCAFGPLALQANVSGITNSAYGTYTMGANESGSGNSAFGSDALRYNISGELNTAIGTQSLYHNVTGWQNTAVGANALRGGEESLSNQKSISYNCAFGEKSLFFGGSQFSTAMGHEALYKSVAGKNVGVGAKAGVFVKNGELNVFVGYESGLGESRNHYEDSTGSICIGAYTAATGDDGIAIGRGVVAGPGQIILGGVHNQAGVYFYGTLNPQLDGVQNIGQPAGRFDTVYAVTGSIQTSDEREKTTIQKISDKERAVALEIKKNIGKYKFKSAIHKKGDKARWHFGVGAQTVKEIFEKHGLNGFDYGILCCDEWDDSDEGIAAGKRYGLRYDELSMFILAAI
ncbi:tail fiber domain-containing protein [Paenibacillus sp. J5C_2022]|uniref:tail fiber domain-containing protein n=1 Tax=Paenibacillus sp. J5C2022 TaxID=2977129 RepID=UPI0021D2A208|nr:tail fiber domain-containing protein [Paenibacillus sp. J5C2022]MCU6708924.1 tail fiber domain-containing protein [Paenibacillus sp. J5C2022]